VTNQRSWIEGSGELSVLIPLTPTGLQQYLDLISHTDGYEEFYFMGYNAM
jgi:hypothetical protein